MKSLRARRSCIFLFLHFLERMRYRPMRIMHQNLNGLLKFGLAKNLELGFANLHYFRPCIFKDLNFLLSRTRSRVESRLLRTSGFPGSSDKARNRSPSASSYSSLE
jgi:hypothetical protein